MSHYCAPIDVFEQAVVAKKAMIVVILRNPISQDTPILPFGSIDPNASLQR